MSTKARRSWGRVVVLILAVMLLAAETFSQIPQAPPLPLLRVPRPSQGAKITQVIGMSDVTINYHRPGVKGREIWGGLLPYDAVWRAGANEPTLFTFSDDVMIGGKKLAAGTYRFVVIPHKEGDWTLVFNSEVKNWGTIYEQHYDTLRFDVKPVAGPTEEWMSFSFTDLGPTSATCVLVWEKIRLPFKIEFNLLSKLQASVGNAGLLSSAARYAVDNNLYTKEATEWVDRSIALDRNFFNLRTKAELLAIEGKTADAIALAEEGLKMIKARDPKTISSTQQGQIADTERKVAEWKSKK
jgi:hypothetical protein